MAVMGNNVILAGDIGGTKTNLALYRAASFPGRPIRESRYVNNRARDFTNLIASFLAGGREKPTVACFGVAGPIREEGWVQMTNLDWRIDGADLAHRFDIKNVFLVNDLVATAMGAPLLSQKELYTVNTGTPVKGNIAVLAPGTGLGEAFLVQDDGRYVAVASEGGHVDFAPRDRRQLELLAFLRHRETHVSVEKVCSGIGLPNIYDFLATSSPVPADFAEKVVAEKDPTPLIVKTALTAVNTADMDHICVRTLRLFLDILAAEAANVSLKILATGGVYIGGGILPRILPLFREERFMEVFVRGVYSKMLAEIPLYIILNPKTALIGAAACGMQRMRKIK